MTPETGEIYHFTRIGGVHHDSLATAPYGFVFVHRKTPVARMYTAEGRPHISWWLHYGNDEHKLLTRGWLYDEILRDVARMGMKGESLFL